MGQFYYMVFGSERDSFRYVFVQKYTAKCAAQLYHAKQFCNRARQKKKFVNFLGFQMRYSSWFWAISYLLYTRKTTMMAVNSNSRLSLIFFPINQKSLNYLPLYLCHSLVFSVGSVNTVCFFKKKKI